jgi:phosphoglycerol transferase MdoB-like AlkP superfamily enzyme
MLRPFLFEAVLFLLPFLAYGLYLAFRRRAGADTASRDGAPLLSLLVAAVVCMAVGLALFAHYGGAPAGSAYIPAHMQDGKLVEPETR